MDGAGAPCPIYTFSVGINQVQCGQNCADPGQTDDGCSCNTCYTLDISNNSTTQSPCDITELDIECTDATVPCFSICCPGFGTPCTGLGCNTIPIKYFCGHFAQGAATRSLTICYCGPHTHTFRIYTKNGAGGGCCDFVAGIPPIPDANYYTFTF